MFNKPPNQNWSIMTRYVGWGEYFKYLDNLFQYIPDALMVVTKNVIAESLQNDNVVVVGTYCMSGTLVIMNETNNEEVDSRFLLLDQLVTPQQQATIHSLLIEAQEKEQSKLQQLQLEQQQQQQHQQPQQHHYHQPIPATLFSPISQDFSQQLPLASMFELPSPPPILPNSILLDISGQFTIVINRDSQLISKFEFVYEVDVKFHQSENEIKIVT